MPSTADWSARLVLGDCLDAMAALEGASIDAVVCDPPYEIDFMGRSWDRSGVAVQVETWAEVLRVLRPGGHLLAFGGTRTYHRMAVAIEDAGFEVRDSLHWIYGSGFPKSLDVSKAIDKKLGGQREIIGEKKAGIATPGDVDRHTVGGSKSVTVTVTVTAPATDEAREWDGWGTGLKPAHEPIVLARKPLAGTVAENVLAHGVGGLNVRGCEIGVEGGTSSVGEPNLKNKVYGHGMGGLDAVPAGGRWPPNVLLSHLPECEGVGAKHTDVLCAPGCPVAELNEMSGESDSGGAARFFYVAKPNTRERVGGAIRNLHPTVKPIDLMRYLVRLVTPPGGIVLDPFLGSGTTGCAAMLEGARFVGVELDPDSYETAVARIGDYAHAAGRARPTRSP